MTATLHAADIRRRRPMTLNRRRRCPAGLDHGRRLLGYLGAAMATPALGPHSSGRARFQPAAVHSWPSPPWESHTAFADEPAPASTPGCWSSGLAAAAARTSRRTGPARRPHGSEPRMVNWNPTLRRTASRSRLPSAEEEAKRSGKTRASTTACRRYRPVGSRRWKLAHHIEARSRSRGAGEGADRVREQTDRGDHAPRTNRGRAERAPWLACRRRGLEPSGLLPC